MANLSVEEIIEKGYITDVSIATALKNGELKLTDDLVKGSITKVADWQDTYVDKTPGKDTEEELAVKAADDKVYVDNGDDKDNVTFTVGTTKYTFAGDPNKVSAKAVLKDNKITEPLYVDGVVFDTKGKKAIDLQGLTFTTELVVEEDDNTPTDGGETTGEPEGDTTGE
jgi:hypothetical protein